jgi:hypothetical protein
MTETAIVEATRRLEQFEKDELRRRQQWEARIANLRAMRTPLMIAGGVLAVGVGASIAYRWMRR